MSESQDIGIFQEMDDAVEAAWLAQKEFVKLNYEKREHIIEAIRKVGNDNAELFARMAVDESKMGNYEHKVLKNKLAANKTPGIEDLKTEAQSGDDGLT